MNLTRFDAVKILLAWQTTLHVDPMFCHLREPILRDRIDNGIRSLVAA